MDEATAGEVAWHDVAGAIPGAVGVQVGERFAYASEELTAALGTDVDSIVGEQWQVVFDERTASTFEREAIRQARTNGIWTGEMETGGSAVDEARFEVTLSGTDAGVLLWLVEPDGGDPDVARSPTGSSDTDTSATGDRNIGRSTTAKSEPARSGTAESDAGGTATDKSILTGGFGDPGFARTLLDVGDDVLYVIDADGELCLWNDSLAETTGYGHGEIADMRPKDFIPADQHEYVPGLMEAIADTGDRRVDVDILTKDGERVTHEFRGTTFDDPNTGEVYRCGLARDVTEQRERERELARYETIVETVEDGIYALDEDLRFTFVNEGLCEITGLDRAELLGLDATELIASDEERSMARDIRRRVVEDDTDTGVLKTTASTAYGERILESRYRLHPPPDGEYRGSVGVIRDVTERERRERALERQRDELAALDRINELLLETARELVETESRDAVERTVCERLAAADPYRFAWVGERSFDGDEVVSRASAGEGDGFLEAVRFPVAGDDGSGPVGRALATGEVQVASVDDPTFGPGRDAARQRGIERAAAVPLTHGDAVFGVLVVYTGRDAAFTPRERAGLEVLGRTVGFVIHAARSRDLLFADAVVELEFRVSGTDSPFVRAATDLGCSLDLEGYVAVGDGWVVYLGVDGAAPTRVLEAASADDRVERGRVVTESDDGGRVEIVMGESSLLHAVTAAGATVRSGSASPDEAHLVVEAPVDVDARSVVDGVQDAFPGAEFVARRERDRPVTTVGRPGGLLEDLTDRQREALQAAYRAGYFSWPRESTAEDVADSLDLAPSTLHGHLRKAQALIFSAVLEEP